MDIYLSLKPMAENEAIHFVVLHLEGVAYEWWHHGLVTQNHALTHSYPKFTERPIARFDRKDVELYYRDLALLKQSGHVETCINEFQHIAVMVPEMPDSRVVMFFIEGLHERYRGLVKALKPKTLQEAIQLTLDLDTTPPPSTFQQNKKSSEGSKPSQSSSSQLPSAPPPPKMDRESRNELRRKKLCFSCKEPWEPGHRCLGKGKAHLTEVFSDGEDEQMQDTGDEDTLASANITIASLSGVPWYYPFRLKGTLRGQPMDCLVVTGATYNFLSEQTEKKFGLQVEKFSGFRVTAASGNTLSCTMKVP